MGVISISKGKEQKRAVVDLVIAEYLSQHRIEYFPTMFQILL
jgi:hypothetical protein